MDFLQAEAALIAQELKNEIGNDFNVNQFASTYPEPNGKLVEVGGKRSKFKSAEGVMLTVDNWIASNIIWGI